MLELYAPMHTRTSSTGKGTTLPMWLPERKVEAHRVALHPLARRVATGVHLGLRDHLLHLEHLLTTLHDQVDFVVGPSASAELVCSVSGGGGKDEGVAGGGDSLRAVGQGAGAGGSF